MRLNELVFKMTNQFPFELVLTQEEKEYLGIRFNTPNFTNSLSPSSKADMTRFHLTGTLRVHEKSSTALVCFSRLHCIANGFAH